MKLCIKVDVDTERGTRIGVPNLGKLFKELDINATFLFSLGPDNTGRAITRIFRRGFLKKVNRTSVISTYGIRTLLNGVFLPGPHIGKLHSELLRDIYAQGFEVGIHAYDHHKWQDGINKMSEEQIAQEFYKANVQFKYIFGISPKVIGAPGWQANAKSLSVYDSADLLYASDCRGTTPFYPEVDEKVFSTLQIPTTLPTIDELIGRPEFPLEKLTDYYISLLTSDAANVMTVHAELEGMRYLAWFKDYLLTLQHHKVEFYKMETIAQECLAKKDQIPVCELIQGEVEGRSGTLAMQKIS